MNKATILGGLATILALTSCSIENKIQENPKPRATYQENGLANISIPKYEKIGEIGELKIQGFNKYFIQKIEISDTANNEEMLPFIIYDFNKENKKLVKQNINPDNEYIFLKARAETPSKNNLIQELEILGYRSKNPSLQSDSTIRVYTIDNIQRALKPFSLLKTDYIYPLVTTSDEKAEGKTPFYVIPANNNIEISEENESALIKTPGEIYRGINPKIATPFENIRKSVIDLRDFF